VLVTASPDDVILGGVVTADGWSVDVQRFLISLGRASAEDEEGTCNQGYSDPNYTRVLDMVQGSGQKLNLVYALGECTLDLELSSPWEDSVLGKGVTATDRALMRTPGSDDYVVDGGISILARATARKGSTEKQLSWAYRFRIDYTNVGVAVGADVVRGMALHEHEELTMDFPIRGGVLFQDRLDGAGQLRFDPMAAADDTYGNGDGEVTLSELGKVPLADIAGADQYADGQASGFETLEDYVYRGLFESVVDANAVETEIFPNDRNPH
jgi:hypothetical protein